MTRKSETRDGNRETDSSRLPSSFRLHSRGRSEHGTIKTSREKEDLGRQAVLPVLLHTDRLAGGEGEGEGWWGREGQHPVLFL